MTLKVVAAATLQDAQLCNLLQPPQAGAQAGGGIQIVIPPNFAALIAQGIDVPGCTYSHVEADGSLVVTDQVQQALAVPANIRALPVQQQTQAAALQAALLTAQTAVQIAAQQAAQATIATEGAVLGTLSAAIPDSVV